MSLYDDYEACARERDDEEFFRFGTPDQSEVAECGKVKPLEVNAELTAEVQSNVFAEFESLLGRYWDIAFEEGKGGQFQGDNANEVLFALRRLLNAEVTDAVPSNDLLNQKEKRHDG